MIEGIRALFAKRNPQQFAWRLVPQVQLNVDGSFDRCVAPFTEEISHNRFPDG
jgi:hypothetical protein